jgi:hypothetical protein
MRASPEKVFTRLDVARTPVRATLRPPTASRSHVYTIEWNHETWVVKDFRDVSSWYRFLIGPLMTAHELRAIDELQGLPGVPADVFRVDWLALAYRYAPGESIRQLKRRSQPLAEGFFPKLEAVVQSVHARGRVHLDLRNSHNVLTSPDHDPILLDFQTSVSTRYLPGPLRRLLEEVDLSGVYKNWRLFSPATFSEAKAARFQTIQRARRWFGYLTGRPTRRRLRNPGSSDAGGTECAPGSPSRSTGCSTTGPRGSS